MSSTVSTIILVSMVLDTSGENSNLGCGGPSWAHACIFVISVVFRRANWAGANAGAQYCTASSYHY